VHHCVGCGEERMLELIGLAQPPERFHRLTISARGEIGASEMVPKSLGMMRIEKHRLLDPLDAFLRVSSPGEYLAVLDDDEVVVRVERQRPLLMVAGRFVVV